MFCDQCGNECYDDAVYCDKCGAPFNYDTRLVSYEDSAYNAIYIFKDMTSDYLANEIHEILTKKGLKLKKGKKGNGVYEKGSFLLNFLVSPAVTNRNKFKVKVYPKSDNMCLEIKMTIFDGSLYKGEEFINIKNHIKTI
jgi:hypothetical protein